MIISKGVPYGEKVWHNGRVIELTSDQLNIWKFLYGECRTYRNLMQYVLVLMRNGINIPKDVLKQTLLQLKSLNLIAFSDGQDNFAIFKIFAENNLIAISDKSIDGCFENKIYERIKNGKCLTDIVADIDALKYEKLTNGHDEEYIKFTYNSIHAYSILSIICDFIKKGNCCLV